MLRAVFLLSAVFAANGLLAMKTRDPDELEVCPFIPHPKKKTDSVDIQIQDEIVFEIEQQEEEEQQENEIVLENGAQDDEEEQQEIQSVFETEQEDTEIEDPEREAERIAEETAKIQAEEMEAAMKEKAEMEERQRIAEAREKAEMEAEEAKKKAEQEAEEEKKAKEAAEAAQRAAEEAAKKAAQEEEAAAKKKAEDEAEALRKAAEEAAKKAKEEEEEMKAAQKKYAAEVAAQQKLAEEEAARQKAVKNAKAKMEAALKKAKLACPKVYGMDKYNACIDKIVGGKSEYMDGYAMIQAATAEAVAQKASVLQGKSKEQMYKTCSDKVFDVCRGVAMKFKECIDQEPAEDATKTKTALIAVLTALDTCAQAEEIFTSEGKTYMTWDDVYISDCGTENPTAYFAKTTEVQGDKPRMMVNSLSYEVARSLLLGKTWNFETEQVDTVTENEKVLEILNLKECTTAIEYTKGRRSIKDRSAETARNRDEGKAFYFLKQKFLRMIKKIDDDKC